MGAHTSSEDSVLGRTVGFEQGQKRLVRGLHSIARQNETANTLDCIASPHAVVNYIVPCKRYRWLAARDAVAPDSWVSRAPD